MVVKDFTLFLPELILLVALTFGLIASIFVEKSSFSLILMQATPVLFFGLALSFAFSSQTGNLFGNALSVDAFANYMKALCYGAGAAVLWMSTRYLKRLGIYTIEFVVILAISLLGMSVIIMANNLIALYVGLELMSLALYVLAAFRRDHIRSAEAGVKYFALGALSSGMFLFGSALVYGFSGGITYEAIALGASNGLSLGMLFGLVFLLVALAFKLSIAPFHMWTPDVYQGAPTAVTAFFATAPKVAAIAMLINITYRAFMPVFEATSQILVALALISIIIGSVAAVAQTNLKRLMAFSSVLNMGFVLLALSAGSEDGLYAALVFIAIYVVMSLGAFALIIGLERDRREAVEISELGKLSERAPLMAFGFAIFMWSMAGLPPLAGFFGKYYALEAAVSAGYTLPALVAVIFSVVGAFYYLRLVYLMYFGEAPSQDQERLWTLMQWFVFSLAASLMIVWSFRFLWIGEAAMNAVKALGIN